LVGVRGHRQHRDYRSYHKGSHLDASLPPRSAREVNNQIMANPPAVIFETDHPGSKHACAYQTRTPENIVEGVYAAFRQPKIWRVRFSHAPIGKDCVDQTQKGRRWDETKIKALTGGDEITARFMRQDFFDFDPTFKLFIAGNHKPRLHTIDEAMRRRLLLVPFACARLASQTLGTEAFTAAGMADGTKWWRYHVHQKMHREKRTTVLKALGWE
jgi:hypothetical protein